MRENRHVFWDEGRYGHGGSSANVPTRNRHRFAIGICHRTTRDSYRLATRSGRSRHRYCLARHGRHRPRNRDRLAASRSSHRPCNRDGLATSRRNRTTHRHRLSVRCGNRATHRYRLAHRRGIAAANGHRFAGHRSSASTHRHGLARNRSLIAAMHSDCFTVYGYTSTAYRHGFIVAGASISVYRYRLIRHLYSPISIAISVASSVEPFMRASAYSSSHSCAQVESLASICCRRARSISPSMPSEQIK